MTTMELDALAAMQYQISVSTTWVEGAKSIAQANSTDDKLIAMLSTVISSLADIQTTIKSYVEDATPVKGAESNAG